MGSMRRHTLRCGASDVGFPVTSSPARDMHHLFHLLIPESVQHEFCYRIDSLIQRDDADDISITGLKVN
jgi:hypothetical protein